MTTQLIQKVSGIAAPTGTPSNRIGTRVMCGTGHTTVAAAVTAIIQTYAVA